MTAILLIEDDAALADLLTRSLRAHGHQVTVAVDAESAATELDRGLRPSLVLLDLNLPGETGWSLVDRPDLHGPDAPPIVVVSAMAVDPTRLREAGLAGYLPKPFALETLLATVTRLASSAGDRRG